MRTNLSSQIVLYQVPQKYYQPNSALESSGISRFEKMKTHITTTALESSKVVAQEIANLIRQKEAENKTTTTTTAIFSINYSSFLALFYCFYYNIKLIGFIRL